MAQTVAGGTLEFASEEAIDNIFGAEQAVKTIEQGQVVIIRNGVHYNLLGMELK